MHEHRDEDKAINHVLQDDDGLQVDDNGSGLQQRLLEKGRVVEVAEGGIGSVAVGLVIVVASTARSRCHKHRHEVSILGVSASCSYGCMLEVTSMSDAPSSLSSAGTSMVLLYVPVRRLHDVTSNKVF